MTIKAVFLDVDGTTVDSENRNRRAITDAARVGGYEIQAGDWDVLAGNSDGIIWKHLVDIAPDLAKVFNDASSFERACLNMKLYRINEVTKYDETDEAIRMFQENAVDIAAVSNSITPDAEASLKRAGHSLDEFSFGLFRDNLRDLGLRAKPHPDPYIEALRRMNEIRASKGLDPIKASECLVLEDSKTGARAGLAAGMAVIQITDEQDAVPQTEADQMIVSHGGAFFPLKRSALVATCRQLIASP